MTLQNYTIIFNLPSTIVQIQSIIRSVAIIAAGTNKTTSFIGRLLVITAIAISWPNFSAVKQWVAEDWMSIRYYTEFEIHFIGFQSYARQTKLLTSGTPPPANLSSQQSYANAYYLVTLSGFQTVTPTWSHCLETVSNQAKLFFSQPLSLTSSSSRSQSQAPSSQSQCIV